MMEVSPHICLFFIIIFLKQIVVLTIFLDSFWQVHQLPCHHDCYRAAGSASTYFPWRKVKGKSVVLPPGSGTGGTSQYLLDVCHELMSIGQGQNSAGNSSDLVTSVVSSSSYPWAELLILKLCWDCLCFSFRRVLGWREAPSVAQTNRKYWCWNHFTREFWEPHRPMVSRLPIALPSLFAGAPESLTARHPDQHPPAWQLCCPPSDSAKRSIWQCLPPPKQFPHPIQDRC